MYLTEEMREKTFQKWLESCQDLSMKIWGHVEKTRVQNPAARMDTNVALQLIRAQKLSDLHRCEF